LQSASKYQYQYQPVFHPAHFNPEDTGSMFLQIIGIHLQDYGIAT
jgi:hypothetical protein